METHVLAAGTSTTGWVVGYTIGIVIVLVVVALVVPILVLARSIGNEAPKINAALTEVSRSGTVLVSWATACTPPVVATRVARIARRWKMTLSRPTAVIAMIRAAMISVTQAAAGMAVLLPA